MNNAPTAQDIFGPNVWEPHPTGSGPLGPFDYNPIYFATQATAGMLAGMLGGSVFEANFMVTGGPFSQSIPNRMIRLPNGNVLCAGLIANFWNHGYPQSYIDWLISDAIGRPYVTAPIPTSPGAMTNGATYGTTGSGVTVMSGPSALGDKRNVSPSDPTPVGATIVGPEGTEWTRMQVATFFGSFANYYLRVK